MMRVVEGGDEGVQILMAGIWDRYVLRHVRGIVGNETSIYV